MLEQPSELQAKDMRNGRFQSHALVILTIGLAVAVPDGLRNTR
jgi:hypothetical protein